MDIWNECLDFLKKIVSEQEFRIWISPLKVLSQGNIFTIYVPNKYFLEWIESKYKETIIRTIKTVRNNNNLIIDFTTDNICSINKSKKLRQFRAINQISTSGPQIDLFSHNIINSEQKEIDRLTINKSENCENNDIEFLGNPKELSGLTEALSLPKNHKSFDFGIPLKKDYTFDNFVVGKANEVARAAAMQVSINLGMSYNPLFIYGRSGLGKTHLMHSIGGYVIENSPYTKVLYVTSERFVKDYVDSVRLHSSDEFQKLYRSVDLLLVDDIQFIAGKPGSQEEFFHTFNTLLDNDKQIVLSCDTYPKEIPKLEERLVSRFGHGLTVTIDVPDLETRTAILLHKSTQFGRPICQNVALFIAKYIRSNVRELEGSLRRVLNYAQFNGKVVNEDLVNNCLRDIILIQEKIIKVDNIQRTVADYYKIKITDLLSKRKSRDVVRPRQIAMTLAKELTSHSLPEIGKFFGGRDHTTVLHAVRLIKKLILTNSDIGNDYKNMLQKLSY